MIEQTGHLQYIEEETLPVGEEDDALDADELEEWFEWLKLLLGSHVEENQPVETEGYRDVVHEGDPGVAVVQRVAAVVAEVVLVQDHLDEGRQGLHQHELQNSLLQLAQEAPVGLQRLDLVEGPWLADPSLKANKR